MMLAIPIMNAKSDAELRPVYLSELKRAGAERVFLFTENPFGDEAFLKTELDTLRENLVWYRENGIDAAVWIGGFGHGGALDHAKQFSAGAYTRIQGLANGGEAGDSFCPADPGYFAMYRDFVCRVVKTGARMIMIDDDLRLAMHGPVGLGCACPRHMEMFNQRAKGQGLIDHDYTREELAGVLFTGPATSLRKVWLELQGDTLRRFAGELRAAIDGIDPTVRLGHCACLSTWDIDGTDNIELARIFAGGTRPFLRMIGAPYWTDGHSFHTTGLGSIVHLERMQLAWCRRIAPEMEIFTEGDAYPRPRYAVPALYLDGLDQVTTAEGEGILKYMLDYSRHPLYETGYIDSHCHFAPLRRAIAEAFDGMTGAGVYVFEEHRKIHDLDCTGLSEGEICSRFTPASLNFTCATALPVSFERTEYTKTALIFGENAKYAGEEVLKMPLILDAIGAKLLTERGVDVGLRGAEPMELVNSETFPSWGETLPVGYVGQLWRLTPAEGVVVDSTFDNGAPASYTYENKDGLRVLVYGFDGERMNYMSQFIRCYPRQEHLFRSIGWMQGEPLTAAVLKQPGAYVLTMKSGDAMAVGIWNFGTDLVMPGLVPVDGAYNEVVGIHGTEVTLEENGVSVKSVVHPGGFAGFKVSGAGKR